MTPTEVPTGLHQVPARCPCGTEHQVLSLHPPVDGELQVRKCDRCLLLAQAQLQRVLRGESAKARPTTTATPQPELELS